MKSIFAAQTIIKNIDNGGILPPPLGFGKWSTYRRHINKYMARDPNNEKMPKRMPSEYELSAMFICDSTDAPVLSMYGDVYDKYTLTQTHPAENENLQIIKITDKPGSNFIMAKSGTAYNVYVPAIQKFTPAEVAHIINGNGYGNYIPVRQYAIQIINNK
jgi:hypothetical protein